MQRPRQGDMEMFSFPYRNRFKFPFLKRSFHEITNEFCSKTTQKRACKKLNRQQRTDTQTDRIELIRSRSGTMFWTAKTQVPLAGGSKTCPQNDLKIQLTSQLKSTSGLPRSLHSPQVAPAAQQQHFNTVCELRHLSLVCGGALRSGNITPNESASFP